jgi:hypothetical protein
MHGGFAARTKEPRLSEMEDIGSFVMLLCMRNWVTITQICVTQPVPQNIV